MSTTVVIFNKGETEDQAGFAGRLRERAASLSPEAGFRTVVLFVDDGEVGAPPQASALSRSFDAALLIEEEGADPDAVPRGEVRYDISRRVIKARRRPGGGVRSEGFTLLCPSVRASFLDHDQFDRHWAERHSRIHVASSPGTCHYEQLSILPQSGGEPRWDGIGLLSFGSADAYTNELYGSDAGRQAIREDVPRFLDLSRGETLPASEFVYLDREAL